MYIKREDALAQVNGAFMTETYKKIEAVPSADVVERKRGKWIIGENENEGWCKCSVCGYTNSTCEVYSIGFGAYNFCPNCGSDMRERKDNE